MQILVKIALILLPALSWGQIGFFKYYAGNGYDYGQGIIQHEDSSYVLTGSTGSFLGHSQAFLMRVDSVGNRIWSNHYGGPENDWGRRVLYQENFGYFVCGHSNSFGNGDHDFYLVKVDENGFEEWEETYGDNHWERVMDAAMTRDTGVVMVGERINGTNNRDMFMVRTDKFGDTIWTKCLENDGDDVAMSVEVYQDSMFIVGGTRYFADSAQTKAIMYKIHENGTMLDTIYFTDKAGEFELNDLHIYEDTVLAIGSNRIAGDQWEYVYYNAYFTATDWVSPWMVIYDIDGDWHGDAFTRYGDSNQAYSAYSFENNDNTFDYGRDLQIQKGSRYMIYQATVAFIAAEQPDVNGEMIPTSDGGAILVGYQENPLLGSGGGSIFLYKIGPGELYPPTLGVFGYTNLVNVEEVTATIEANVYPNPSSGIIMIEMPTNEEYSYRLTDAHGRTVVSGAFFGGSTLNLDTITSGVYLLTVENDSGRAINRIIIE